jgi:hypothetical protein
MKKKSCTKMYKLAVVKEIKKLAWKQYKKKLSKTRKVTKKDEKEFTTGFKHGFMDSCKNDTRKTPIF